MLQLFNGFDPAITPLPLEMLPIAAAIGGRCGVSSPIEAGSNLHREQNNQREHYCGEIKMETGMKSLIAPLLASASFAMIFVCGMVAASGSGPRHEVHRLNNLDSAIWTSRPVKVERAAQTFQRIAPEATVADASPQTFEIRDPLNTVPVSASPLPAPDPVDRIASSSETPAKNVWCHARYRSYREADNSYQPFSGGGRLQCMMPSARSSMNEIADATAAKPTFR